VTEGQNGGKKMRFQTKTKTNTY